MTQLYRSVLPCQFGKKMRVVGGDDLLSFFHPKVFSLGILLVVQRNTSSPLLVFQENAPKKLPTEFAKTVFQRSSPRGFPEGFVQKNCPREFQDIFLNNMFRNRFLFLVFFGFWCPKWSPTLYTIFNLTRRSNSTFQFKSTIQFNSTMFMQIDMFKIGAPRSRGCMLSSALISNMIN